MELQDWAHVATIATAVFALLVGIATLRVLVLTNRVTRNATIAYTMTECSRRFDTLLDLRHRAETDPSAGQLYWDHFWDLQMTQYRLWKQGAVAHDDFCYLLRLRNAEWRSSESYRVGGETYADSWERIKRKYGDARFVELMERIHLDGDTERISPAVEAPRFLPFSMGQKAASRG